MHPLDIILVKVVPILGLILLGMFLRKWKVVTPTVIDGIKKLILNVTFPAIVFQAMLGVKIGLNNEILFAVVYLMWAAFMTVGFFLKRLPRYRSDYFPMLISSSEGGMLGYALFTVLYGVPNIFNYAAVNLGNSLYFNTLALFFLLKYKQGAGSFKKILQIVFTSPIFLCNLSGVLLGNLGAGTWLSTSLTGQAVSEFLRQASLPTVPLISIAIGYEMNLRPSQWLRPVLTMLGRLAVVLPIGGLIDYFLLGQILHADEMIQAAFAIMIILPPAFVLPLFIRDDNCSDKDYVQNTLTLGTLITLPLFIGVTLLFPAG